VRDTIINVRKRAFKYRYGNRILSILEFPVHTLKHSSNTMFHEKSMQWKPSFTMRTRRRDEGTSRFSQFCESAWEPDSLYCTHLHQYTLIRKSVCKFRGKRKWTYSDVEFSADSFNLSNFDSNGCLCEWISLTVNHKPSPAISVKRNVGSKFSHFCVVLMVETLCSVSMCVEMNWSVWGLRSFSHLCFGYG
jgi:hypothetical protein